MQSVFVCLCIISAEGEKDVAELCKGRNFEVPSVFLSLSLCVYFCIGVFFVYSCVLVCYCW